MLSSSSRTRRPDYVRPLRTFTGHTDTVRCVAFFPDNRRLVSSSWDNTIRIWDLETGLQTRAPLTGHTDVVRSVAVSPNGDRIASASEDHTLRVWDVATGELLYDPVEGHASGLWCVTFSPDGRRIATTGDNTIRIWDASTGGLVAGPFRSHNGNLYSLTYSPDGLEIASVANDKTVRVCDSDIGQMLVGPMEGHENDVRCVLYTPDGQRLVTASDDGTIRVWNVITGEQIGEPLKSHTTIITSIAISRDGTFLATAGPSTVMQIWNLSTRQEASTILRHANDVSCVAFSLDGRYIAGGCCDFRIWLWDASLPYRSQSSVNELAQQISTPPPIPSTPVLPQLPLPPEIDESETVRHSPTTVPLPPSPLSSIGVIPRTQNREDDQEPVVPAKRCNNTSVDTTPRNRTPSQKNRDGTELHRARGIGRFTAISRQFIQRSRRHRNKSGKRSGSPAVHVSNPSGSAQVNLDSDSASHLEDADEILFLCCYFARTKRH
ncbi:WD40-repeat-containing domain protein [Pisolithus croceorrhizus]|nr:WD40-repeat-containing domain protein [Pisolithus croceorrhizus]KAI6135776.1 WD40-repeat-containing domain protein [Pisolithus croceorrhizus]